MIVLKYLLNVPAIFKLEHLSGQITSTKTAKILIGILPQEVVGFISETWGERVSDKYLTEHCGILRELLPGDIVLADCGFNISESVGSMQAKLHIHNFQHSRWKKQGELRM